MNTRSTIKLRSSSSSSTTTTNTNQKNHKRPEKIVIAGAGIIGISTAYYLTHPPSSPSSPPSPTSITLIDPTGQTAPCASGRAAGFLALNWNDHHPPTARLARRSYALHEDLATRVFGTEEVMYRRTTAVSVRVGGSGSGSGKPTGKKLEGVEWVEGGDRMMNLGGEETIAQVHPKKLCDAMWREVGEVEGVRSELVGGKVVGAVYKDDEGGGGGGRVLVGAELEDGRIIPADAVLFACGPWTLTSIAAASSSSSSNDDDGDEERRREVMLGVKYHSAVVPTDVLLNQSVFFDGCGDPEVYARPDSTAYCTGFPDPPIVVTERPGSVTVRPDAIQKILTASREASSTSSSGGGGGGEAGAGSSVLANEPTIESSCYLPTTIDGVPMMGRMKGPGEEIMEGCYVAAGHGCWGILLGPGSGEAMASLMLEGVSTEFVDMDAFRPGRFGW